VTIHGIAVLQRPQGEGAAAGFPLTTWLASLLSRNWETQPGSGWANLCAVRLCLSVSGRRDAIPDPPGDAVALKSAPVVHTEPVTLHQKFTPTANTTVGSVQPKLNTYVVKSSFL